MKALFLAATAACAVAGMAWAGHPADETDFVLSPNPAFLQCLAADGQNVQAAVHGTHGELNDRLDMQVSGLKPGLAFDIFAVQRTSLGTDGKPDPKFPGSFGLAW